MRSTLAPIFFFSFCYNFWVSTPLLPGVDTACAACCMKHWFLVSTPRLNGVDTLSGAKLKEATLVLGRDIPPLGVDT
ncbi:hypothetical protein CsSME_00007913 [Camellia sinensis var. sinensis]